MKKDILGAIIERRERINSAHIPTWDELPSLNLYMDPADIHSFRNFRALF